MAKLSIIARERKRHHMVQEGKIQRDKLRALTKNINLSFEERMNAVILLNKRSRDESAIRMRTRCHVCGRPRAVYKKFGLCRIHLREAAMRGDVPGLVKASW